VRDTWLEPGQTQYSIGGLAAGGYRVRAYPNGGNYVTTATAPFTLADGQARTSVNLVLAVGARVSGSVTGPSGAALSGVDGVDVFVERQVGTTDAPEWDYAGGTWLEPGVKDFTVVGLATGEYRVTARPEGGNYLPGESATFTLAAGQTRTGVSLVLVPGAQVSGRVTGPGGAALTGVDTVHLSIEEKVTRGGETEWEWVKSTVVEPGASYALGGLGPGTYRIEVVARDGDFDPVDRYLTVVSPELTLTAGQQRTGFDLALRAAASVAGTVTGPGGAVLTGVDSMQVRLQQRQPDGFWTNEEGHNNWSWFQDAAFTFTRLEPGTYRVQARTSGNYATTYSASFTLTEGQARTGLRVPLDVGASVSGRIVGPGGGAVSMEENPWVVVQRLDHSLWDESEDDKRRWEASDFREASPAADGTFRVEGLRAGNYILSVKGAGGFADHYSQPFTVAAGQSLTNFGVQLERPGSLSARIVGDPAREGCDVYLERRVTIGGQTRWLNENAIPWDGDWGWAWSGLCTSPSIALGRLSSGTYRLSTWTDSGRSGATYFTLGTAETKSVEIELGKDDQGVGLPATPGIVNVTPPVVSGAPTVGSTLSATRGTWDPADVEVAFQWYRGGSPIEKATGQSYVVTTADVGRTLSVRATATKDGHTLGTATSAPTAAVPALVTPAKPKPVVKQKPVLKVSAKAGKRKATVTLRVSARGVPAAQVNGRAAIYLKGKRLRTVTVKNGKAVLKISKQKKGKRAYTVKYLGNAKVKAGSKSVRISIR